MDKEQSISQAIERGFDQISRSFNPAMGQEGWTNPTLTNSWANFGAGYAAAGYMKDRLGFVHLKGLVKTGTSGNSIFTLPVGYRPAENHYMPGLSNDLISSMVIGSDGKVTVFGGAGVATWTTLSHIVFRAEA